MVTKYLVARLTGGLGNQLFIYATAKALSLRTNRCLVIDTVDFKYDKRYQRQYELDSFLLENEIMNYYTMTPFRRARTKLAKIRSLRNYGTQTFISKKSLEYYDLEPLVEPTSKVVFLEGTWQSYKHFHQYPETIKKCFSLSNDRLTHQLKSQMAIAKDCVSIHIRFFYKASSPQMQAIKSYYSKAIRLAKQSYPGCRLLLFSDNIDSARQILAEIDVTEYLVAPSDFNSAQTLILMSCCRTNIIADSTFSWWAGWLNNNSVPISPRIYRTSGQSYWGFSGLIPPSWIQIDC